jgi:hypothetical protein
MANRSRWSQALCYVLIALLSAVGSWQVPLLLEDLEAERKAKRWLSKAQEVSSPELTCQQAADWLHQHDFEIGGLGGWPRRPAPFSRELRTRVSCHNVQSWLETDPWVYGKDGRTEVVLSGFRVAGEKAFGAPDSRLGGYWVRLAFYFSADKRFLHVRLEE